MFSSSSSLGETDNDSSDSGTHCCWLLERKTNPLLLSELARIAYRDSVGPSCLESVVAKMPFAGAIKRYILLENILPDRED